MLGSPDEQKANTQESDCPRPGSEIPQDFGNISSPILMILENKEMFGPDEEEEKYTFLQEALSDIVTYSEYVRERVALLQQGIMTTLSEADRPVLQRHALALPPEGILLDQLTAKLRGYANLSRETMMSERIMEEIGSTALRAFRITHPEHGSRKQEVFRSRAD